MSAVGHRAVRAEGRKAVRRTGAFLGIFAIAAVVLRYLYG
jgi:hypothetical protein